MSDDETALEVVHAQPMNLFGADSASAVVHRATDVANSLAQVIEEKRLYAMISGKKHVLVEGWTLLGSMLGVFPVTVWTRRLDNDEGWEARVEAVTRAGEVVGAAESMCSKAENRWKKADEYAIRSMAATRATAKALRLALGFVVTLAGFEATPAEELGAELPQYASPEQVSRITDLAADAQVPIQSILERWQKDTLESLAPGEAAGTIRHLEGLLAPESQENPDQGTLVKEGW